MTDADTIELAPIPDHVTALIGEHQYEIDGGFPVEHGYIWSTCASTENGNPLFWDEAVADSLTAGPTAPPTMLSVWFRPHHWSPGRSEPAVPLQVHFDLKELLSLPEAIISENTITFGVPVRIGDRIRSRQVLKSISDAKTTKLGTGRFWVLEVEYLNQNDEIVGVESYTAFGYRRPDAPKPVGASDPGAPATVADEAPPVEPDTPPIDVGAVSLLHGSVTAGDPLPDLLKEVSATTVVLGALASRDWRPMHHDYDFAVNRNGTRDIFLNTPNQAAWFERYITDWTGPRGRLGQMTFRMRDSVYPGDQMKLAATVTETSVDDQGCGWVSLDVALTASGRVATTCSVKVAVPTDETDNPWARSGDAWQP